MPILKLRGNTAILNANSNVNMARVVYVQNLSGVANVAAGSLVLLTHSDPVANVVIGTLVIAPTTNDGVYVQKNANEVLMANTSGVNANNCMVTPVAYTY